MYSTEKLTTEISVEKYIEEYVNVEEFLECCKKCPNYARKWSCPPYDFDVLEYWKQFKSFFILGNIITFDEDERKKDYRSKEITKIINDTLFIEKRKLADELYGMEKEYKGSVSLSAGSCTLCDDGMVDSDNCNRVFCKDGNAKKNCLYFDKMRYSIESLGGNVGKTCSKLFGVNLEWVEENKLPSKFILVSGLLKK